MCVRCEPAAHAAAARVLNAARMERACPLHVRCGCLGGRGAGPVTATTRALRGSEIPSPPSEQSETDDGTFQDLRGLHIQTSEYWERSKKCAALSPQSRVYVRESVQCSERHDANASLISHSTIVVMSLVAFSGVWCDVCLLCPLWVLARYRSEGKSLTRACALCSACDGART